MRQLRVQPRRCRADRAAVRLQRVRQHRDPLGRDDRLHHLVDERQRGRAGAALAGRPLLAPVCRIHVDREPRRALDVHRLVERHRHPDRLAEPIRVPSAGPDAIATPVTAGGRGAGSVRPAALADQGPGPSPRARACNPCTPCPRRDPRWSPSRRRRVGDLRPLRLVRRVSDPRDPAQVVARDQQRARVRRRGPSTVTAIVSSADGVTRRDIERGSRGRTSAGTSTRSTTLLWPPPGRLCVRLGVASGGGFRARWRLSVSTPAAGGGRGTSVTTMPAFAAGAPEGRGELVDVGRQTARLARVPPRPRRAPHHSVQALELRDPSTTRFGDLRPPSTPTPNAAAQRWHSARLRSPARLPRCGAAPAVRPRTWSDLRLQRKDGDVRAFAQLAGPAGSDTAALGRYRGRAGGRSA